MPCVSKRLETTILSSWANETDLTLESCSQLNFNLLVPQHLILTLEYTILSAYLRKTLVELQQKEQEIDPELMAQILTARKIAIFLSYLYENKLDVPREAVRFRKDELFYRTILNQPDSPLQNQLQNPWAIVLNKVPDSEIKPTFAELSPKLKGRDAVVLLNNDLYYLDQHKETLRKIAITAKNQADFEQLKSMFNSDYKLADNNDLQLIQALTGRTQNTKPKLIDTQTIRNKHVVGNWIRVFTVRSRRVLNNVRPFITDTSGYHPFMESFEEVANPFFSHFAWAFYAPRLITNVGILLKHVLPHPWMSKEEENLALSIRLNAHIQRRWFEIANDAVWLTSGLLGCFLLLGPLLPVASYLVAALYAYDIVIAGLRAFIELRRLYQLRRDYDDAHVPMELRKELHAHIAYERRRLYTNVGYMIALTVAIALTIPILVASGPFFPLVGAALLVAVTLISFIILKLNEKTKPMTQTPTTSPYRFFKAAEQARPSAEAPAEPSAEATLNPANLAPSF